MVSKASLGNQSLQAFASASLSHWPELGPVTNEGGKLREGGDGGRGGEGREGEGRGHADTYILLLSIPPTHSNLKIVMHLTHEDTT